MQNYINKQNRLIKFFKYYDKNNTSSVSPDVNYISDLDKIHGGNVEDVMVEGNKAYNIGSDKVLKSSDIHQKNKPILNKMEKLRNKHTNTGDQSITSYFFNHNIAFSSDSNTNITMTKLNKMFKKFLKDNIISADEKTLLEQFVAKEIYSLSKKIAKADEQLLRMNNKTDCLNTRCFMRWIVLIILLIIFVINIIKLLNHIKKVDSYRKGTVKIIQSDNLLNYLKENKIEELENLLEQDEISDDNTTMSSHELSRILGTIETFQNKNIKSNYGGGDRFDDFIDNADNIEDSNKIFDSKDELVGFIKSDFFKEYKNLSTKSIHICTLQNKDDCDNYIPDSYLCTFGVIDEKNNKKHIVHTRGASESGCNDQMKEIAGEDYGNSIEVAYNDNNEIIFPANKLGNTLIMYIVYTVLSFFILIIGFTLLRKY